MRFEVRATDSRPYGLGDALRNLAAECYDLVVTLPLKINYCFFNEELMMNNE